MVRKTLRDDGNGGLQQEGRLGSKYSKDKYKFIA